MESELASVHQQMEEQESEAVNAITKWQQNVIELEEKCAELEENLKKASESKDSVDTMNDASDREYSKLKDENASLRKKIDHLETSSTGNSHIQVNSEIHEDVIVELREALKIAQDTLSKDEKVVQQWEGK